MSKQARTTYGSGVAHCHVCCDDKFLEEFRVLRCGHCFCTVCLAELKTRKSPCPVCRQHIRGEDDRPIFITLVDTKLAKVKCVIDDLNKVGVNMKEESVRKVGERIEEVLEESAGAESDLLPLLWKSVEEFKTRITGFYATSKQQTAKIDTLQRELASARLEKAELNRDLMKAKSLEKEHMRLQLRVKDAEQYAETALTLAERGKDDAVGLREEAVGLRETLEKERNGKEELERENKKLKVWLDEHLKIRRMNKEKISSLRKQIDQLRDGIEARSTIDDSLIIVDDEHYESSPRSMISSANNLFTSTNGSEKAPPTSPLPRICTNLPNNDFECLPGPRPFKRLWPSTGNHVQSKRKPGVSTSFPIDLDKMGHVKGSVQLGPKRRVRVHV